MKECTKCDIEKPETSFGDSRWCKQCHSDTRMEKYWKNRDTELLYKKRRQVELRIENYTNLRDYFKKNPCVDCGETDPVVLELDHVRGKKDFDVSARMGKYRWDRLFKEIQKCDVRCSNCHRRKTAKRGKWYYFLAEDFDMDEYLQREVLSDE